MKLATEDILYTCVKVQCDLDKNQRKAHSKQVCDLVLAILVGEWPLLLNATAQLLLRILLLKSILRI